MSLAAPNSDTDASRPQPATYAFMVVDEVRAGIVTLGPRDRRVQAVPAEHVLNLVPGQRVAVLMPEGSSGCGLVVAAFPREDAGPPALAFDAATETVTVSARRVRVVAADELSLTTPEASFVLRSDGSSRLQAERIVASAIETHRIEGGAIELN